MKNTLMNCKFCEHPINPHTAGRCEAHGDNAGDLPVCRLCGICQAIEATDEIKAFAKDVAAITITAEVHR